MLPLVKSYDGGAVGAVGMLDGYGNFVNSVESGSSGAVGSGAIDGCAAIGCVTLLSWMG